MSLPDSPAFVRLGPAEPRTPVVIAVPHAGRDYPDALLARARVARTVLEGLEDRHADLLAERAIDAGTLAFVARRARVWIDLNRDEREIDPAMIEPPPRRERLVATAKVRGGLGLFPRRLAGSGELMRGRLSSGEAAARIAIDHRPWHQALAEALAAARRRFGTAILLDCHSMPPLGRNAGIVIGDLHGRSANGRLVQRVVETARGHGLAVQCNEPYAGGHALERHGAPGRQVHAIQIEVDRALYLDEALREPGPGLPAMQALVAAIAADLAEAALPPAALLAAE